MEPSPTIEFSNTGKVLFPSLGITKGRVIEYYIRMAPRMLPHLEDRAVMLHRFPEGVDHEGFYEKDAPAGTPSWVTTAVHHSETADRDIHYIVCDRPETLAWLANLASLELHVTLSRVGNPRVPLFAFFDLDPQPPAQFPEAAEVALQLRDLLVEAGVRSYLKTSGKKGLHVLIPLEEKYTFRQVRDAVHSAGILLSRRSDRVVHEASSRAKRPGSVLVDYAQNAAWKTMICPYSLRAREEATVSMPISWQALESGARPEDFNIGTVSSKMDDPWRGILSDRQEIWTESE
jgi:bifunctional non-homologous end joining protein LigD